jgi:hypothetical protein
MCSRQSQIPPAWVAGALKHLLARKTPRSRSLQDTDACRTAVAIPASGQEKIFMRDRQSRQSPHPRQQFIKDLISFINNKRRVNHDIMLNLDANEILGEETQGISKLM